MSAVQFLSRWQPDGAPLYHRRLSSQWHDMCAESLGMPKVALCFLTRGNVHQVDQTRAMYCVAIMSDCVVLSTLHARRLACAAYRTGSGNRNLI